MKRRLLALILIALSSLTANSAQAAAERCPYHSFIDLNEVADRTSCIAVCNKIDFTTGCTVGGCRVYCREIYP